MEKVKRRHRLSYSTLGLLHSCPRKLQLRKFLRNNKDRPTSPSLSYGTAYGDGVQEYLRSGDLDRALFGCWKSYWPIEEDTRKDQVRAMLAVQQAIPTLEELKTRYRLAQIEGKPLTEMSFKIDIDDTFYFIGYIDAVLEDRITMEWVPLEIKTTGLLYRDLNPLYANSHQGLGYRMVLDSVLGQFTPNSRVIYLVSQLQRTYPETETRILPYNKTLLQRFKWLLGVSVDVQNIKSYLDMGVFPPRNNCFTFGRPCEEFGTCDLHGFDEELSEYLETQEEIDEQEKQYDVTLSFESLLEEHYERIGAENA